MPRYALSLIPALLVAVPAAAADEAPLTHEAAMRCGVLNSLMAVLEEGDAEKNRARNAMALTWFSLANDMKSLDEGGGRAVFDRVHSEEGEAVVAVSAEGAARADHLLKRLDACDELKYANASAYRSMADFLASADAAQFAGDAALRRQGKEPPPLPEKDLTFGDGWTFQSRGNNCTATRPLGKGLTLQLAYTNFSDGYIWVSGKGLPRIDGDAYEAEEAKHGRGAGSIQVDEENFIDGLDPGLTYASFPGTAVFIDGEAAARFVYGETSDGETNYKLGSIQSHVWPRIKKGKELRVKALGKELGVVQLPAAGGLWAEMQSCIDQYPDG